MRTILNFLTDLIRGVCCPRCCAPMPMIRRPTSTRQMLLGGWSCHQCGCEMDRSGRLIDPGHDRVPS